LAFIIRTFHDARSSEYPVRTLFVAAYDNNYLLSIHSFSTGYVSVCLERVWNLVCLSEGRKNVGCLSESRMPRATFKRRMGYFV